MKKFEITKPIKYPSGYLLLRINDKRDMKQVVNIDKELDDLINFEKNKQLNQFSLLFFKKLKLDFPERPRPYINIFLLKNTFFSSCII